MAGYRIYSFDWKPFVDLTTNPESATPVALGEMLQDSKLRKKLRIPAKLPTGSRDLAVKIRDVFLQPEWYVDQPPLDIPLRQALLNGLFFDDALKSFGMALTPAWREFYDCCSFDLGAVLAGKARLNLERMQKNNNKEVFYQYLEDADPGDNPFRWLGNRPYRFADWEGGYEDQETLEEDYGYAVYSIQSPEDVEALAEVLTRESPKMKQIDCAELHDACADYEHCIYGVQQKKAGMYVEVDT
jgi:hypothetical protein